MKLERIFSRFPLRARLPALLAVLKIKRNDELGGEQEQSIVRAVLSTVVLAYLIIGGYVTGSDPRLSGWLTFLISYIALSLLIALLAFRARTSSGTRRLMMNAADIIGVSYVMVTAGKAGIPLFILYLWITLGNGFRYGPRAMLVSAVLSVAGFSSVVMLTPAWQQLGTVAVAIVIALIALPLYSARFLRPLKAATADVVPGTDNGSAIEQNVHAGPSWRDRLRARLQNIKLKRHDELGREQGQTVVRVVILAILLAYLIISHYPIDFDSGAPLWLVYLTSFLGLSLTIMVLAFRDTKTSVTRRTVTNIGDTATISYLMISTGEAGIPFFVLYLWVTLGNGFRFGIRALFVSAALSIVGFTVVAMVSEVWRTHPMLIAGVFSGMVLIPGYTAHLIRQLHAAKRHAEEASAAKGRFLARMSHELRTPLNGILGATELLAANKRLRRDDHSLLDVIRESVNLSLRQIDNVLDFSKIEAGKLSLERTAFDLHELLNRTTRLVRGIAADKNLRLMLRIDPAVPYRLVGDPHYVQEALLNLLSNAIKFTGKGYVSLDVDLIFQNERSALIRLAVHDTGIGIEPQALNRIFEAFSQEDVSTTRRYGGTGLGTTISKQLIDLMGGRLEVTSEKNKGSIFSAEIPFAHQPGSEERKAPFAGMRILLISENKSLQERLAEPLRKWGATLHVTSSIPEAIGLLARGIRLNNPLHAILVDSNAALTANGKHRGDDFLEKAWLSFTPAFLLCDVSPEPTELRNWGYASLLSYDVPHAALFNALHACGFQDTTTDSGVVQVEPWAWNKTGRQRPRLLVADDNRTNLAILRKILETANFEVDTASDGEQALEMLLNNRYKAAVLDMHMPGLDGTAVIKQYRLLSRGARIPIVMLTANATVNAKLESAEAGADAYLTKPATAEVIISTIKRLLDETEIHTLSYNRAESGEPTQSPIFNPEIIMELDRLYNDPTGILLILDEFEREGRRILDDLAAAAKTRNHAAFCDLLHALKSNGANIGAMRLNDICAELGACGLLDFRREVGQMLRRLEDEFAQAARALREFTAAGGPGPARDSDLR